MMSHQQEDRGIQRVNLGRRIGSRYFILTAGGNRDALMQMHAELNLPGSTLKKLLPNPLDKTPDIERWLWESLKVYCKSDEPISEINEFIESNAKTIELMAKYGDKVSLNVCLGWKFIENKAHGFYFPPALMQRLSASNFGLEIDIANWG